MGERGFPRDAIIKELRRANKLKCSFCTKIGANIGCAIEKCTKKFHYPCAVGKFSFIFSWSFYSNMCFKNDFSDNGYICVTDNRTNPVFCIKHSTAEFRRELSKGRVQKFFVLTNSVNQI